MREVVMSTHHTECHDVPTCALFSACGLRCGPYPLETTLLGTRHTTRTVHIHTTYAPLTG